LQAKKSGIFFEQRLFLTLIVCIVRPRKGNLWSFCVPESENTFVLAVETSGRVGSVAIGQGDTILYESSFSGFMKHSAELFDSLDNLLTKTGIRPNQIGHLYITAGPGSFTGIRIAVTLAKMTAYAIGTRIVAIDTLDALAENAAEHLKIIPSDFTRIATILDAKQSRFFVSIYEQENGLWKKHLATSLLHPEELITLINKDNILTGLLGEGLTYYADSFASPLTCLLNPSLWPAVARGVYTVGRRMAKQGRFTDPALLIPAYIRKPDALEKWEQKNVSK
jgi:tRNA threonylcarbamoyladenosine biosynthesis protein TsaB